MRASLALLLLVLPASPGALELDQALSSAEVVIRGRIVFAGVAQGSLVATAVVDRVLRGSPGAGAVTFSCSEGAPQVGDAVLLPLTRRPGQPSWSALLTSSDAVALGAGWAEEAVDAYVSGREPEDWARALLGPEEVARGAALRLQNLSAKAPLAPAVRDRARQALALVADGQSRAVVAAALARSGDPLDVARLAVEARVEPEALSALDRMACSSAPARNALLSLAQDGVRGASVPRCGPPVLGLAAAAGLFVGAALFALGALARRRSALAGHDG